MSDTHVEQEAQLHEQQLPTFVSRNGGKVILTFPDAMRTVAGPTGPVMEKVPIDAVESDEMGVIRPRNEEEVSRIRERYGKTLVREVETLAEARDLARAATAALAGRPTSVVPKAETAAEKIARLKAELAELEGSADGSTSAEPAASETSALESSGQVTGTDRAFPDVTTVTDAAEVLASRFHIPVDALKGGNGRPSRDNVEKVAAEIGVTFPNL